MIEKIISTSWNIQTIFDEPVKVAEYNPEVFVPDEIKNFITGLQPDPRFCFVHVIAMSDGGMYGSNLNGDIFKAAQLLGTQTQREADKNPGDFAGVPVPRYKTFEMAKFYRHHANSPIDPAYGDVPLAVWNEPMRRVELIIRIYKQNVPELNGFGAPDIVAKLDQRGFLTVSMGCRIHHEQCTYCGNENEFVHQRCECLKNRMNEIMPNGQLVAADNFEPRFFDISDVTIPADPIAFSLSKVATATATVNQTKVSNVARNVTETVSPWHTKFSQMDKQIMSGQVGNIPVDVPPCETCEALPEKKEFTHAELKVAFECSPNLNTFVSTTALMGMTLSPHELAFVTSLAEPEKAGSADQNFTGISHLSLDNFSLALYHALQHKVAERSGYQAVCPMTGWEPTKIAGNGFQTVADYYSFYRKLLATIPVEGFTKAAHKNPYVRQLLGNDSNERYARVKSAMYHLAHAGMATV